MRTLPSATRTVRLDCDYRTAFRFLADPTNLPRWAINFCQGIRRTGASWSIRTPDGEVGLELETDRKSGVIDYNIKLEGGISLPARSRLIPNGDGAEYIFTQYHFPEMSYDEFETQVSSLEEEFQVLSNLLKGGVSE